MTRPQTAAKPLQACMKLKFLIVCGVVAAVLLYGLPSSAAG